MSNVPQHVALMSHEEFKKLLTLVVMCELDVSGGRLKTKTSIELANYLKVLNGDMTLAAFAEKHPNPFGWKSLQELKISAITACCYIRAFSEAGLYGAQNA